MHKVLRNTDAKSLQVPYGMMWRYYERSRQNRDERMCACPSTFPQLGAIALEEYACTRLCALPSHSGLSSRDPPPFVPRALLARNTVDDGAPRTSKARRHHCGERLRPALWQADSQSRLDAPDSRALVRRNRAIGQAFHPGVRLSADGHSPIIAEACLVCMRNRGRVLSEPGRTFVPRAPAIDQPGPSGAVLIEVYRGSWGMSGTKGPVVRGRGA